MLQDWLYPPEGLTYPGHLCYHLPMTDRIAITKQNAEYWDGRASTYSDVNRWELAGESRDKWKSAVSGLIGAHYGDRDPSGIRVLDIGCGPGFFAVILTELGYDVTAMDLSEEMLAEARDNAAELAADIHFVRGNAEALDFRSGSFDVIISRNLTWNIPHPDIAYGEWCRVLADGGLLLNFDANWYHYLYDEEKLAAYEADRARSVSLGLDDQNVGENFDVMEEIARDMPLSRVERPAWDFEVLSDLGMTVSADTDIWQTVWTEQEKVNFASTPLFVITAVKP